MRLLFLIVGLWLTAKMKQAHAASGDIAEPVLGACCFVYVYFVLDSL